MLTTRQQAFHLAKALLFGAFVAFVVLSVATLVFVLVWGPERFLTDFWPPDNSRVGPNLVASVAATVAIVAHNEYRAVKNAVEHKDHLRQILGEMWAQTHPVTEAEKHVADVLAQEKDSVLPKAG